MIKESKDSKLSGKYWVYQVIGFSTLVISNLLILWGSRDLEFSIIYGFLNNYGFLFLIVSMLRMVYRKLYKCIANPIYFLLISTVGALIGAFFWVEFVGFGQKYLLGTSEEWHFKGSQHSFLASVISSAWAPFLWSILYFGIKYWQDLVVERKRARDAMILAQKAHLQMLRYQLNPHFLFNSLNSIQALVHENPDQADNMVAELSEFLRYTLRYNDRIMISVREEIDITHRYLNIEKIRYEERLNFEIVSGEDVLEMEIPCFITQPLVENSIKHGLLNNQAGIDLKLIITRESGLLRIKVSNSGSLSDNWKMGVGLKNILERLENSYPGRFRFTLGESGGYVIAEINISLDNEKDSLTDN